MYVHVYLVNVFGGVYMYLHSEISIICASQATTFLYCGFYPNSGQNIIMCFSAVQSVVDSIKESE